MTVFLFADLEDQLDSYLRIRENRIGNDVAPALFFMPLPAGAAPGTEERGIILSGPTRSRAPADIEELAFASVRDLAELVRTGKVTSTELTKMFLDRLKRFGSQLECVITLTEDLALAQAWRADEEIAAGRYRGPLHGIPYGAKDLLAVREYRTTWGAMPYKDQMIDGNATVIRKLEDLSGSEITAGQTIFSLKASADYMLSDKFILRVFYDQRLTTPYISNSYPNANYNVGFSMTFTL